MESPMTKLESEFRSLLAVETLVGLETDAALNHLARLIDLSFVLKNLDGTNRAIQFEDELRRRQITPAQTALLDYYLSNAWSNRTQIERQSGKDEWKWEQPEVEKQIIHLRRALGSEGFEELDTLRQCQILTNLGNLLNTVGRFVEAVEYWDKALAILPAFGMGEGNR